MFVPYVECTLPFEQFSPEGGYWTNTPVLLPCIRLSVIPLYLFTALCHLGYIVVFFLECAESIDYWATDSNPSAGRL